jgi:hypothetical protein
LEIRTVGIKTLKYARPDGWVGRVPTVVGNLLDRLRLLSERLAEKYKWTDGQATAFVLADRIPLIGSLDITLKRNSNPLFSRIVLEVDPTLSPREIAEAYRRKRLEIMPKRYRNLSEKHIQLALFNAEQSKGRTWGVKMAEWNKTQPPEWAYKDVGNFSHDSLEARRHLLRIEKEYNTKGNSDIIWFELSQTSEG